MTKDEALDLALKVMQINLKLLEKINPYKGQEDLLSDSLELTHKAITAINQARSAPVQEPVAWRARYHYGTDGMAKRIGAWRLHGFSPTPEEDKEIEPLYTTPPAAPVQEPLSTETIMQMARDVGLDLEPTRNMLVEVRGQHAQLLNLVRAVESAHRITKG
jgi:hypothetical protein